MTKSCLNREINKGLSMVINGCIMLALFFWPFGVLAYWAFTLPDCATRNELISQMNTIGLYGIITCIFSIIWIVVIAMPITKCYFSGENE